jgi:ribose transport system ATP-binding protein
VLLEMKGVAKSFGATRALDGVSLEVESGEVRALIGENGAGKSTLMKILSGAHRPDAGSMRLAGEPYAPRNPREARARGVAMIYQELALAPHLSVESNIMLGQERVRAGLIKRKEHRKLVADSLALLEHPDIRPEAIVGDLGVGAQQLVEVARALVSSARLIVFDEPTSSLSEHDAQRLFAIVERLRAHGLAIIYISHFLEEARRVAQTFTVLRDGKNVASGQLAQTDLRSIIKSMVGRNLDELFPRVPHTPGEPILELDQLRVRKSAKAVSLELKRGEILGIAGLIGAGRTRLVRSIFGLAPVIAGRRRGSSKAWGLPAKIARRKDWRLRGRSKTTSLILRSNGTRAGAGCASKSGVPRRSAGCRGSVSLRQDHARRRAAYPAVISKKWHSRDCFTNKRMCCFSTSRREASMSAPRLRFIA